MNNLRWGILGTGRMAGIMAAQLGDMRAEGMEVAAVGSRDVRTAQAFAARHAVPRFWGSCDELAADRDVDVVYVATPHSLHADNMLACVRAGKSVLCEKPFTLNAPQARSVIEAARQGGVFLMEAMWTRYLPAVAAVRSLIESGAIGRVQLIVGGGAFVPNADEGGYLLDKALGGGALLDAGVYLVSMASMILGQPTRIQASGVLGATGVDENDAILLEHSGGALALLYISLRSRRAPDLEILGDAGRIAVAAPIFKPAEITLTSRDGAITTTRYPVVGSGYGYQIRAVVAALNGGRRECPIMPLDETLSILTTMDTIRGQIGLRYAGELASCQSY